MRRKLRPLARRKVTTSFGVGPAPKQAEEPRRCLAGLGLVVTVALVLGLATPAPASTQFEKHWRGSSAAGMMSGSDGSGFAGMMGASGRFGLPTGADPARTTSFGPGWMTGRYGTNGIHGAGGIMGRRGASGNSTHSSSGSSSMMVVVLIGLLSGVALIGVAIWKPWRGHRPTPLEILRKRLATGQITTQEYEARRRVLTGGT